MTDELSDAIRSTSVETLTPIVQSVLGGQFTPEGPLEVTDIGQKSAGSGTLGIFRVSGVAHSTEKSSSWAVVVKVVSDDATGYSHNKASSAERELDFYSHGALTEPRGGLRAAICYKVETRPDGSTRLWLEDLAYAVQPPWSPGQFVKTARQLGAWNGHWSGANLPKWPWLSQDAMMLTYFNSSARANLDLYFEYRDSSLAKRIIDPSQAERISKLFDEAEMILDLTSGMPQVLCHVNAMPKNLFPASDPTHGEITVGIDWASVGPERPGADAIYSLASAGHWLELSSDQIEEITEPVFNAYCEGLTSSGWSGDIEKVRLVAYAVGGTAEAITIACFAGRVHNEQRLHQFFKSALGMSIEDLFDRWRPVMAHALRYADRAVALAHKIRLDPKSTDA